MPNICARGHKNTWLRTIFRSLINPRGLLLSWFFSLFEINECLIPFPFRCDWPSISIYCMYGIDCDSLLKQKTLYGSLDRDRERKRDHQCFNYVKWNVSISMENIFVAPAQAFTICRLQLNKRHTRNCITIVNCARVRDRIEHLAFECNIPYEYQ